MHSFFQDIRAACQSAQSRIMRLQQATNTQVGLTSIMREGWFDELRHVAQCFITAQQASAKIEQAINTERAQLQGALSAALNERDVTKSERDSAQQEVQFLRSRLDEFMSKASTHQRVDNSWTNTTFDVGTPFRRAIMSCLLSPANLWSSSEIKRAGRHRISSRRRELAFEMCSPRQPQRCLSQR